MRTNHNCLKENTVDAVVEKHVVAEYFYLTKSPNQSLVGKNYPAMLKFPIGNKIKNP
jgi:hypothetical protein